MDKIETGRIKTHRDLEVCKISLDLVERIYQLTAIFPKHELYGIISQLRSAAVSVPANIAEGFGRFHRGELLHFLSYSMGSLSEMETLIIICRRLTYINSEEYCELNSLLIKIRVLLSALNKRLAYKR